jgi:hypothetical protein
MITHFVYSAYFVALFSIHVSPVSQVNSLPFNAASNRVPLIATLREDGQSFSLTVPPITRALSQGPCRVLLSLDVNGVSKEYFLGTFLARSAGIEAAFRYAFDQPQVIVSMVLCGVLGWGNSPVSNVFVRSMSFTVALLLIIPETGVELTFNNYDLHAFYQLRDPVFGISVLEVAFVIVYSMLFILLILHFANSALSLPLTSLQRLSKRVFFHSNRQAAQMSYVKTLLNDFRWAYKSPPSFKLTQKVEFSYVKEARMMISGVLDNKDAFYLPIRLQVALLLSTLAFIPILVLLLQGVYSSRALIFQTIMPFVRTLFAFINYMETQSWFGSQQPLLQNSNPVTLAFSKFEQISSFAELLVFSFQTSAYIGIACGLLRFVLGQVSLLLVARSNLLAARRGAFKIDQSISDYSAFFFIGNQIACSILGFVIISFLVSAICFALTFPTVRELLFDLILGLLPVIIFAVLQEILE